MLCVSISEKTKDSVIEKIKNIEMAEIRIEELTNVNSSIVKEIFSAHNNLIATFRPNKTEENKRVELLIHAIENGAAYVDIEIESNITSINKIIQTAKNNNCKIIISYHNYNETPLLIYLEKIVKKCFDLGADIAKVAIKVNKTKDNVTIISLYSKFNNILAIGMGKIGKISRIASIYCGAPFTFVSYKNQKTAPGQISYNNFEKILKLIDND